jgi:O-antigen ligase
MRFRIHREIFYYCNLMLAFFLPVFPRILPAIITLMALNWLVSGDYIRNFRKLAGEKWRIRLLSFTLFYLVYLIGMSYSTEYGYGWFDLEVKLSLLVFPLIFATSDLAVFTPSRAKNLLTLFIAGCITGALLLLGHAWFVTIPSGIRDPFYYTNLSWYFHTSYIAMYYTFAIAIASWFIIERMKDPLTWTTVMLSLAILFLEAMIFLLSSKAGIMTLVITQALLILLLISRKAGLARILIVSLILIAVFAGYSRLFPFGFGRMASADSAITSRGIVKTNPDDGTVARIEIWKVSAKLIRENFWFGVGTGDVKSVYLKAYEDARLYPIFKQKLNAHNQYIQTFVALGVIGFCALIFSLLIPAWLALRKGYFIYFIFILIFACNILVESMFETQAGVVFYAFFNAFLFSTAEPAPRTLARE